MALFTVDLDRELTYDLVEQFLRFGDPEQDRPQESPVLDYNENLPSDLADVVCAFSNTYGGLIILGVKEKQGPLAIPEAVVGIPAGPGEIKQKIVNMILSSVQPRPRFSVGVVAVPSATDRFVAVVRVEEGEETPYMWLGKSRISVRVEDSNRAASLEQVKDLVARGSRASRGASESVLAAGDLYVMERFPSGEARSGSSHQLVWAPARPISIRLDRRIERDFVVAIKRHFKGDVREAPLLDVAARTAAYTDVEARNPERDYHRKWRLMTNGAAGFISKIGYLLPEGHPGGGKSRVDEFGRCVADTISFIHLAQDIARAFDYYGSATLRDMLELHTAGIITLKLTMPGPDYEGSDAMVGVSLPSPLPNLALPSLVDQPVAHFSLMGDDDTADLITTCFLHHVRSLGGIADWSKLSEQVKHLLTNL